MNHLPALLAQATQPHPYRPFLDPISLAVPQLHDWWWLTLIPIALFVSMAYKGVRLQTLEQYWKQVIVMMLQIILAMIGLAIGLYLLIELVVPLLDR
jgi:hypothetical protein